MICDITSIPPELLQLPNGLLVFRLPSGTQDDLRQVGEIAKDMRSMCHPSMAFVVLKDDAELTHDTLEAVVKRVGLCLCTPAERETLDSLP